eukprot:12563733-Alexandrium_andersonii.AAC.1
MSLAALFAGGSVGSPLVGRAGMNAKDLLGPRALATAWRVGLAFVSARFLSACAFFAGASGA